MFSVSFFLSCLYFSPRSRTNSILICWSCISFVFLFSSPSYSCFILALILTSFLSLHGQPSLSYHKPSSASSSVQSFCIALSIITVRVCLSIFILPLFPVSVAGQSSDNGEGLSFAELGISALTAILLPHTAGIIRLVSPSQFLKSVMTVISLLPMSLRGLSHRTSSGDFFSPR